MTPLPKLAEDENVNDIKRYGVFADCAAIRSPVGSGEGRRVSHDRAQVNEDSPLFPTHIAGPDHLIVRGRLSCAGLPSLVLGSEEETA